MDMSMRWEEYERRVSGCVLDSYLYSVGVVCLIALP